MTPVSLSHESGIWKKWSSGLYLLVIQLLKAASTGSLAKWSPANRFLWRIGLRIIPWPSRNLNTNLGELQIIDLITYASEYQSCLPSVIPLTSTGITFSASLLLRGRLSIWMARSINVPSPTNRLRSLKLF